ncbi:MAG TPA: DUF2891 domain-containing protein [Gemmatimonadaceae bacterium]|jgi:hypothetical protein
MTELHEGYASQFARLALTHVQREYPNKLDHVLHGRADVRSPRELHPIFFGSFDWHSCVHAYWLLATVYRLAPRVPEWDRIRALFNEQFTPENVAAEVAYVREHGREGFERPYGWAWLLMLSAELSRHTDADGHRWYATLHPLAHSFAARFRVFLPKATYAVRVGTHFNSAFALTLALEYAETLHDHELRDLVRAKAMDWYSNDADCQAWEPGGDDFLSPALIEVELMRRVLDNSAWRAWLDRFLPRIASREPATLFTPVTVSDRSDGKIAHLDGLNLSRAWCWRRIASSLPAGDARIPIVRGAAEAHVTESLPHVTGEYAGEHWLATYALLAVLAE